jgi:hypothetical protein
MMIHQSHTGPLSKGNSSIFPSLEGLTQEEAFKRVKELERNCYPDLFGPLGSFTGMSEYNGKLYAVSRPSDLYYPGLPLLTPHVVTRLQHGGTLLSVGSGHAYGEQMLVTDFGIPRENIDLADITSEAFPPHFKTFEFDMYKRWPNLGRKYDFIIFRNSTLLISDNSPRLQEKRLAVLIDRAMSKVSNVGEVRLNVFILTESIRSALEILGSINRKIDVAVCASGGTDKLLIATNKVDAR